MVVTLGAPYYDENGDKSNYSFKDHIALYDWAFSEFVYTNIVKMNEQVTQVDVKHGKDVDKVGICASEDYYTLLEKSLNKTTVSQNVKLYSESHLRLVLPDYDTQHRGQHSDPHKRCYIHSVTSSPKPENRAYRAEKLVDSRYQHHQHYNQPGDGKHHRLLVVVGLFQDLIQHGDDYPHRRYFKDQVKFHCTPFF